MQSSRRPKKMKHGEEGTQSTGASPTVLNQQHYLTKAVFGNDLVFREIADYLGTSDLKILRQTCKLLLGKVNSHRTFTSNMQIRITDEVIGTSVVNQSTFELKSAKVVVNSSTPKNISSVQKWLTRVADLKLFHPTNDGEVEAPAPVQTEEFGSTIRACYKSIRKFSNLRTLTLDLNIFGYSICTTPLKDCVSTIKELRILGETINSMPMPLIPESGHPLTLSSRNEWKAYRRNMKKLGSLDWRLKSFVFKLKEEIPPVYHAAALNGILTSSAQTLETVLADSNINNSSSYEHTLTGLNHLGEVHETVFPSLKAISFSLDVTEDTKFASFLAKQPPLESIQLIAQFLIEASIILDAIKTNCCSIPNPKLHTLEVGGVGLLEKFSQLYMWDFLKDLKKLRNFKCIRASIGMEWYAHYYDIYEYLPTELRSLELVAIPGYYEIFEAIPNRFKNLRALKILHCVSLKDSLLHSIYTSMTGLRVLHLGRSNSVTDFGLTGGKSLMNLKGLQELVIAKCPKLTHEALVKSIGFLELRVLKLLCILPDAALVEIAKNNPSLEFMVVGPPAPKLIFEFRDLCSRIAEVNPRIARILREFASTSTATFPTVEPEQHIA